MYSTAPGTRGPFGDFITDSIVNQITENPLVNEIGDVVGDTVDFAQDPSAGDFFEIVTPAVAEDIFDGGGLDDFGYIPVVGDVVDGDGFTIPFGPTIGPNAPSAPAPTPTAPTGGSCPIGFKPNPDYNPMMSANLMAAGTRSGTGTTRNTTSTCIPDTTTSGTGTAGTAGTTYPPTYNGLDEDCKPIPRDYTPPTDCIPTVAEGEGTFFQGQRTACQEERKVLEQMEEAIKARYEQLCIAREKFNQRQERYGGMCGPYEMLYGISEEREREDIAKAKAEADCLKAKNKCGTGNCGGCGCANKTSSGCGCGCTGKKNHSHAEDMEYEYVDPVKSSCKQAVDEAFGNAKKTKPRTATTKKKKINRMPTVPRAKSRSQPTRKAKASTCIPCGVRKAVTSKTGKRQCVQI